MSSKGILQFFTKATPEEAEEQQKQCWETLHDELCQETIDSRVNDEQEAINQAERMRERSCHHSKAYQDQCRTQLEVAGEDNPRRNRYFCYSQYVPIKPLNVCILETPNC